MTDNKPKHDDSNDEAQRKLREAAVKKSHQGDVEDDKAHIQDGAALQNPKDLEGDIQRGDADRPVKSSTGR